MRVQLTSIHVRRNGNPVLQDLNLETRENEYVVILGTNGSGKSTTLRAIAGLQPIHSGTIHFEQLEMTHRSPRSRSISMVFQDDALYPHLKVSAAIKKSLPADFSLIERKNLFDEIISKFQLKELVDRYPDQLSGGEARRTAIARAMAKSSQVRLLDEPLTALAPTLRPELLENIQNWHRCKSGTTIHVTHDAEEAMQVADRIAVLSQGKIIQFATPIEIYKQPSHLDAATALGNPLINLIDYDPRNQIAATNQPIMAPQLTIPPTWLDSGWDKTRKLIVGVRPQHWVLSSPDTEAEAFKPDGLSLRATVHRVWNGFEKHHAVAIWNKQLIRMTIMQGEQKKGDQEYGELPLSVQPGQVISLYSNISNLHFFDPVTGVRLRKPQ